MEPTRLKQLLDSNGSKQTWLAEKAGINVNTLSKIVNGKAIPNLRTAQRIARALGKTVDDLWPLEEEERQDTTPDQ